MITDSPTLTHEPEISQRSNHGASTLAEPPRAPIASPLARSARGVRPGLDIADLRRGQILGQTSERRSICCLLRGRADAPLKVMILAGQHGDERPARQT